MYFHIVFKKLKFLEDMLKMFENKFKEIDAKIANLAIKIGELEEKYKNRDRGDMTNINKDFFNLDDIKQLKKELEELKKEIENLKNAHGQTIIKVNNNKEQIDLILGRLDDIIKGYKDGDEKLQKEIDDLNKKLSQINSQIDLLLKMPRGAGDGKMDLSGLNELMKKIIDLENDYREFVEKVNIEEIYRQLKFLHNTKADKKDLNIINNKIDDLNDKYDRHQIEIESIKKRLDGMFSQLLQRKDESGEQPVINVDFSQYVSKTDFEKHRKENEQEFKKIWEEIEKLKELIDKIFNILNEKASLSDLEDLKNFLLGKLDEFAIACNKKFADKNETTNNFRYLEDQLKKILEMLAKKDSINEADNWLLAKKPINGYSCAACESYIGDLRDDANKFIPWNKMPLRDPGDNIYRKGNGFSKMLQMLNFDSNGNVILNPNIINEASINSNESGPRVSSAMPNNNLSNNNTNRHPLKNRVKSANPKIKIKESKLNSQQSKEGNIEIPKAKNDVFPDIYDASIGKNEDKPKITKIFKKPSSRHGINRDNGYS